MEAEIRHCGCYTTKTGAVSRAAQHQDCWYGTGQRVHSPMQKEGKLAGWRCTVCGKEIKNG